MDIGCGSGYPNAVYLCNKGFKLRGIDASEEMIRIAKAQKTHNESLEVCDVFEYKPVGTFDGILAWDSLFHLPYKQQDVIYKKIADWLNDGGWFLFSHSSAEGEFIGEEMFGEKFYYSGLSVNRARQLLTEAGLITEMMKED